MLCSEEQILDQVLLVQLDVHIWSARKKLRRTDLNLADDQELPPESLASLGSKKVIDHDILRPFHTLKREAVRICETRGVRFLGGYAIAATRTKEVADELERIKSQFESEKASFLATYDAQVQDWIAKNPTWAHALAGAITPSGYVDTRLGFDWHAIQVKQPAGEIAHSVNKAVSGLQEQLFSEIADTARDILEGTFHGKERVTQRALARVCGMRDKLQDLTFLSAQADPLVSTIDYTLSQMPTEGPIEGLNYQVLYGLLALLSDAQRARDHGDKIINGSTVEEAVSEQLAPEIMGAVNADVNKIKAEELNKVTPQILKTPAVMQTSVGFATELDEICIL